MREGTILLDCYETVLENGTIAYYAIPKDKKKGKIRMNEAFKEFYNDDNLAIIKREFVRPELFDLNESELYIPLRTAKL